MGDGIFTIYLQIARDVYGRHPDELTEEEFPRLRTFAALKLLENEMLEKEARDRNRQT